MIAGNVLVLLGLCLSTLGAPLYVHVIAHSHCDAGYRKTFDDYYNTEVKNIITTVVEALIENPIRTFVWEEVSYFMRWWQDQTPAKQAQVIALANSGRLEFIGGGWVMADEADATFTARLEQMTVGLQALYAATGHRPKYAWHIDPFGHSAFSPYMLAQLGYSAFVINRIPDPLKQAFKLSKHMEFIWPASPLYNSTEGSIFAHVLDSHYITPPLAGTTVQQKADSFAQVAITRAQWFKSNHILIPFGSDFAFQDAPKDFAAMDPILAQVNKSSNGTIVVKYSTLNDFFTALQSTNTVFPVYPAGQDFFPYIACADCGTNPNCYPPVPCGSPDAYWSGFYTSKPWQKILLRYQDTILRQVEALYALRYEGGASGMPGAAEDAAYGVITTGRQTSGLLQHHDAVPGTSFTACYDDYNTRLNASVSAMTVLRGQLANVVLGVNGTSFSPDLPTVFKSVFGSGGSGVVVLSVGNPLAWTRSDYAVVGPLPLEITLNVAVTDQNGNTVPSQVIVDKNRNGQFLVFTPANLPPLSVTSFFVSRSSSAAEPREAETATGPTTLSNGVISLAFDAQGSLSSWTDASGANHAMTQSFIRYGERLETEPGNVCTGSNVYAFVPEGPVTKIDTSSATMEVLASGPLVWEAVQKVNSYLSITWRIFKSSDPLISTSVEVQAQVGVLPILDTESVAVQFDTTAVTRTDHLFTDDNGYITMMRSINQTGMVQANTWPLVRQGFVDDGTMALGLTTRRAVAASSPLSALGSGSTLQILTHRRINDPTDPRGWDTSVIDDVQRLSLLPSGQFQATRKQLSLRHEYPLFVDALASPSRAAFLGRAERAQWAPMVAPLPDNAHMLTIQALAPAPQAQIGLRMQNMDEVAGSPAVAFDLAKMFVAGDGTPATPYLLTPTSPDYMLNTTQAQAIRMHWLSSADASADVGNDEPPPATNVTLAAGRFASFSFHFLI